MGREVEERILRRALEKGLVEERDLGPGTDREPATTGRWGPRIERLLVDGHLDEFAVAALAEEVATLPIDGGETTQDASPGAPIDGAALEAWGRYRIVARLGSGGSGEVFRAHDPRLARDVALKFLLAERPELLARFRREAQAQARIEHEHVCKVFEVGEVSGRSFIAMQFVDGETLGAAAPGMAIEERVRLVRLVAGAVHAAHRLGIVHRDLKPGNVLVERDPDGGWKPWVVDFGLAREMDRSGTTMAGRVIGTPSFMAPEQARGEAAPVDRRCDVYGLGATLFAVLAGRPPFLGSTIEVLLQVVGQEAPPLRRIAPSLPADLETIVARCLEKDPSRRYDSARALGDELGRFLDGEPILARRARWSERLGRLARRHRALVAVAAVGIVAVAVVTTLWVRSALLAREEARLSQRFGAEAQAIESLMRVAHLLPAHDIRPDRARVRARMRALEETMTRGGAAAEGPGHYALGRGALAIGDRKAARGHLERAWSGGYRTPEVAYALGQVLGEDYEAALDDVLAIPAGEEREARKHELSRDLRDPALAYLRAGRGAAAESPALVEGLIAFREDRWDDALAKLADALGEVPSLYEGLRLTGDVYTHMSVDRRDRGDGDGARDLAARAAEAYRGAQEIARSDETIHVGECLRRFEVISLDWNVGRSLDRSADEALAACERALVVDPDDTAAYTQQAAILVGAAEHEALRGNDPRPMLARAVARAGEALARDPQNRVALAKQCTAWFVQADKFEIVHGIDPRPSYRLAIESCERSNAILPLASTFLILGGAHDGIANWERLHGGDPRPHWERAAESYRQGSARSSHYALVLNLGVIYLNRADYELGRGIDPRASVEAALSALLRANELNPSYPRVWKNISTSWYLRAMWERAQRTDCRASADEATRAARRAIELKADWVYAYDDLTNSRLPWALQQLDRGLDPSETVREALASVAAARRLNARDKYGHMFEAQFELIAARSLRDDQGAAARFAAAEAAVARAAALDPQDADAREIEAEIHRRRAEWRLRRREPAGDEIDRGVDAAAQAIQLDPEKAEAYAERASLLALRARVERDPDQRSKQEAEARADHRRALEKNPLLKRDYPEP